MREGRIIGGLLKTLSGIETQEIWINRDLSMRAAFGCGDDDALYNWLVRTRIRPITANEAIQRLLGRRVSGFDNNKPIDLDGAEKLLTDLQKAGLLQEVKESAAGLAQRLIAHWQGIVSHLSTNSALLLDFACAGNIQRSIQTVFNANGISTPVIGLNFVTTTGSIWAKRSGCVMQGCLAEDGEPAWMAQAYARTPELIEIFAAALEGPLLDYTNAGAPILGSCFLNSAQVQSMHEAQQVILKSAAIYRDEMKDYLSADLGRCVWGRLLLEPLASEIEVIANWPLDVGLDGSVQRTLAPCLSNNLKSWTKLETAWPSGSQVRTGLSDAAPNKFA